MDNDPVSRPKTAAPPPGETLAMFRIGLDRHKQGDLRSAVAIYEEVLRRDPRNPDALQLLGLAAYQSGQSPRAVELISQALAIKPETVGAHSNRGLALTALGRFDEALADFDAAIVQQPGQAGSHQARGGVLQALRRFDEAVESYDRALAIAPHKADLHSDRATALKALGQRHAALEGFDAALALDPANATAWYNRGATLRELGRIGEAILSYDAAIARRPDFAIAHHNRSHCRLQVGDYAAGFEEYEWRKRCPTFDDPRYGLDRAWRGEPLQGRSLYIYPELFQGDLIQFCRYARAADEAGAQVTLAAPRAMHSLLQTLSSSIRLLDQGEVPDDYDVQCALMSLPHVFGTTPEVIPTAPYLQAEPRRIARWRQAIGGHGLKLGAIWQGSTAPYALPLQRSFPLAALSGIAAMPGVRLISLQKQEGLEQLNDLPAGMTVETLGDGFDPGPELFVDTAAAMMACDLVISPDTSVAHLAGALGAPTWIALAHVADWRWMTDRGDSPWYPTARLFRQAAPGDWTGVFSRMADAIGEMGQG